ncbi:MAG: TlpA family protein disulfide reductase [Nitrospinae bacterium]|nr:TlpA family protein disulfide reductase [Nitrospinota bacterium]
MATALKDKPFRVVAVNMQEGAEAVKEYRREMGLSFPMLLDTTGEVSRLYGARATPTHFLIDAEGKVAAGNVGAKEWMGEGMRQLVEMLLPKP